MRRISTTAPEWMLNEPKPELELRRFHNVEIEVWVGHVSTDIIEGWHGNPRTELQAEQFSATYGRWPNDNELYQIVLADDDPKEGLKIRELAGSIYKNGVRVPVVFSYDKRLLDGNRRYYACKFLATEGAKSATDREKFSHLPAIVLPGGTTSDTENAIMTEFNFASDFRVEWPYYIKAMRVFDDYVKNEPNKKELESKYGVPWRYLDKWIQAAQLCNRFLDFHEGKYEAKLFAYRHFIMFDEMMRNYGKRFSQANFREDIFRILLADFPDNQRFYSHSDVLRVDEIWDNEEAWDVLVSKKGQKALREALAVLEVSAFDSIPDPNPRLKRVVKGIEKLATSGTLAAADKNLLQEFHHYAERVPGAPVEPAAQVSKMIEWLDAMTSKQISELRPQTLDSLRSALERVLRMAEAVASTKVTEANKD